MKKILVVMLTVALVSMGLVLVNVLAAPALPHEIKFSENGLDGWTDNAEVVIENEGGVDYLRINSSPSTPGVKYSEQFNDFKMATKLKFLETNADLEFIISFRFHDGWPNIGYRLVWRAGRIDLEWDTCEDGGSWAIRRNFPVQVPFTTEADTWYDLEILANGTHIEFWVDGAKIVDYDETFELPPEHEGVPLYNIEQYTSEGAFMILGYNTAVMVGDIYFSEPLADDPSSSETSSEPEISEPETSEPESSEDPVNSDETSVDPSDDDEVSGDDPTDDETSDVSDTGTGEGDGGGEGETGKGDDVQTGDNFALTVFVLLLLASASTLVWVKRRQAL